MDDFMQKEDRQNLKELNRYLGTKHRTKPYDMKNPQDIIEATVMATAEYVDLAYYWSTLIDLEESFDETVEIFHPSAWVNMGLKGTSGRQGLDEAIISLRETGEIFYGLLQETLEKCTMMWRIVFYHSNHEVKSFFFDEVRDFDGERVEMVLEEHLFEIFLEVEYDGVIENSVRMFAKALEQAILGEKMNI